MPAASTLTPSLLLAGLGFAYATARAAQPPLPEPLAKLDAAFVVDGVVQSAFHIRTGGRTLTLVLSRTGTFDAPRTDPEAYLRSARLYATMFEDLPGDQGARQRWRIQDLVDECPADLTAEFTEPALRVSDADADGEPEIWVAYRIACRGDVSPSNLKIIGYEGTQKYALRGRSRISLGESQEGGDAIPDAALAKAPELLALASSFWAQVRDERF